MPFQTHISFPFFSLTSKAPHKSAFKKLKMESDRKNMVNKEMVTDILMIALLAIAIIILAFVF